jgi:hypothetical protein
MRKRYKHWEGAPKQLIALNCPHPCVKPKP